MNTIAGRESNIVLYVFSDNWFSGSIHIFLVVPDLHSYIEDNKGMDSGNRHLSLPLLTPEQGMGFPYFKTGSVCQNTLKIGVFYFRGITKDRIYSQKTGFETRVFGNTRL
jgi:hypothetical protein